LEMTLGAADAVKMMCPIMAQPIATCMVL
jgi:hypothetical protein